VYINVDGVPKTLIIDAPHLEELIENNNDKQHDM